MSYYIHCNFKDCEKVKCMKDQGTNMVTLDGWMAFAHYEYIDPSVLAKRILREFHLCQDHAALVTYPEST